LTIRRELKLIRSSFGTNSLLSSNSSPIIVTFTNAEGCMKEVARTNIHRSHCVGEFVVLFEYLPSVRITIGYLRNVVGIKAEQTQNPFIENNDILFIFKIIFKIMRPFLRENKD